MQTSQPCELPHVWKLSAPMRLRAQRKWLADMTGRHALLFTGPERPDEDDPAQTKTNDNLANEHAGLEHKKTANLKQARRAWLCSPR